MKVKKLVLISIFISLCIVGGNVKIFGSIALDLAPAILGCLIMGPLNGAVLAFFGHMISAMLAGFPLSIVIHLVIGSMMALAIYLFGLVRQKGKGKLKNIIISDMLVFVINSVLSPFALIPFLGLATIVSLMLPLVVASAINIILAEVIYVSLPATIVRRLDAE